MYAKYEYLKLKSDTTTMVQKRYFGPIFLVWKWNHDGADFLALFHFQPQENFCRSF